MLVHGALEDSSLWTHGVIQGLQRKGYPVKAFSNPLRGVAVDAAYLRSVLDTIEGSVILVSHAYVTYPDVVVDVIEQAARAA